MSRQLARTLLALGLLSLPAIILLAGQPEQSATAERNDRPAQVHGRAERVKVHTVAGEDRIATGVRPQQPSQFKVQAGDDEALQVEKQRVAETLRLATAAARSYDIFVGTKPETKLELDEKSILRWSNPLTGAYGEVFLWTKRSRPLVIASIYQYYGPDRYMAVAFQSLAPDKLTATRGSEEVWYPSAGGVEFKVLGDAARPAASKSKRLVQMRALARDFRVRFTTPESEKEWLRLLPQPGYRYQCEDEKVLDGTIFIFVQGTNPEAILLLEARQTDDGDQWHFALARQTGYQMNAFRVEKEVWSVPTALGDQKLGRAEPYRLLLISGD